MFKAALAEGLRVSTCRASVANMQLCKLMPIQVLIEGCAKHVAQKTRFLQTIPKVAPR